ncbi:MAG: SLBB domain-containing protein [Myxococcales bacterium]|nr:SLBB domain-containing protein [Myxococcales bacterium]MCB9531307.1 SLBB domain-containing protein [Myxococcales bacterium]
MLQPFIRAVDPRISRAASAVAAAVATVAAALVLLMPRAGHAQVRDDRIQPGDQLIVVVPEQGEDEAFEVVVDERGEIALGIYGRVRVGGLEESAALSAIQSGLRPYLRSTYGVRLTVQQRGLLVFVTGAVETPGMLAIPRSSDIWTAIQAAGGALAGADLRGVVLMRGNSVMDTVDVRAYLTRASTTPLPTLDAGDTIFVPADTTIGGTFGSERITLPAEWGGKIFVLGAVQEPGVYDLTPGLTVVSALALAGGPETEANLSAARLITGTSSQQVDLAGAMTGPPGDVLAVTDAGGAILYVPAATGGEASQFVDGISVIGNFNTPRHLQTAVPVALFEVIALAGGPNGDADMRRCAHVHQAPGVSIASEYNLRRFLRHGGALGTVQVYPGDVLYLRQDRPSAWETFVEGFSDVAVISSAFLLFVTLNQQVSGGN